MEWSKYNYLFNSKKNGLLLYNSLSNSFAELDENQFKLFEKLKKIKTNVEEYIETDELKEQLLQAKIIVESDKDEVLKIKFGALQIRFYNAHLELTIIPTLDCNFNCPYCYEDKHKIYMEEVVVSNIIEFIKKIKKIESLAVTWMGGEPLLAFNNIKSITDKILELKLRYNSSIITNGYHMTTEKIELLEKLKIRNIQITLDGLEKVHNKRRSQFIGDNSFERIISNLDILLANEKEIGVNIRVNIDDSNKNEFIKVYTFLKKDIQMKIYLSHLHLFKISMTRIILNSVFLTD